jgi:ParB family chromosome partitioning protein
MAKEVTYVCNQLYYLPTADLQADPDQPRKYFDPAALDELTASIARNGVMTPVFFRIADGKKIVVAGERRCAAAVKAGMATVPAIYVDAPNYTEISLIENMVRADLTPVEEAEALDRLMKDHEYRQEQLGEILSKSQAYISAILSLNRLPAEIRDECRLNPSVPKKTLLTWAGKKRTVDMMRAYQNYKEKLAAASGAGAETEAVKVNPIFGNLNMISKKIAAVDPNTMTKEERKNYLAALQNLARVVEEAMAAMAV